MLHAVHPIAEEALQRALRNLSDAELLYVRGIAPEATYLFKHALIRDAAYEALLKSRRKDLHRVVARTIDEQFTAFGEAHPEVLARHWTEAGETEPAIAQWSRAGEAARAHNAFTEALESYRQALMLLNTLPESRERDLRELELTQSLVWMLQMTRAYSAPETSAATERAAALAEKIGNLKQLLNWMFSRYIVLLVSGELSASAALADQALEIALREGSPASLGMAYGQKMFTCNWAGDPAGTEQHFTQWIKFFGDPAFRQLPGALVAGFSAAVESAWMLGRADVARQRMAQLQAAVSNPYDIAFSSVNAARLCVDMREYEQAEALAARALDLSEKNQFLLIAALSRVFLGRARAELGGAADGIGLIRRGIAGCLEVGTRLGITIYVLSLAAAQMCDGAFADALETVQQALQANPDELPYRPEILRLRGELRLELGQTEPAGAGFREAIDLARSMGAKSWELRATISLADLLAKQGRRDEARTTLAEIYCWFTEGFDTPDLKDAKALLEELNNP